LASLDHNNSTFERTLGIFTAALGYWVIDNNKILINAPNDSIKINSEFIYKLQANIWIGTISLLLFIFRSYIYIKYILNLLLLFLVWNISAYHKRLIHQHNIRPIFHESIFKKSILHNLIYLYKGLMLPCSTHEHVMIHNCYLEFFT
jgi:hypothetical protein